MADDDPGTEPLTAGTVELRPLQRALVDQQAALLAYVQRYLPPPLRGLHDPADVVQDVAFEALRRESSFDPAIDPTGRRWLFTLAHRRLIRLMDRRTTSRQVAVAGAANDESLGRLLEELAVYERTPSASAASHETWAAVQLAFGRLAANHAAVIRARYYDRESSADFGARTGRTAHAVDNLCSLAMRALRLQLRAVGGGGRA